MTWVCVRPDPLLKFQFILRCAPSDLGLPSNAQANDQLFLPAEIRRPMWLCASLPVGEAVVYDNVFNIMLNGPAYNFLERTWYKLRGGKYLWGDSGSHVL